MNRITESELRGLAAEVGLELAAVLTKTEAEQALRSELNALAQWQAELCHGEMQYMARSPNLFASVESFLPEMRSIVSVLAPYHWKDGESAAVANPLPLGYGRVARYAWGHDYHRVLKKRLQRLLKRCAERFDEETLRWRIFTDAVPLLERALARSAGLGFVGKNTMLIRPGVGSYTFIGELLWNVEIEPTQSLKQFSSDAGCGSCSRCLNVCPTGALPRPGRLDARRCISYLTIEKKTAFEDWERKALGEWVFGCDLCQEVCPYNHSAVALPKIEEFSAKAGVGPILNLQELLSVRTREGFLQRFKGTPLMRAGREALLRNACCVLGNTKAFQAIENLRALAKEDSSGLVRYHAAACLDELLDDSDGLDRLRIASATRKRADQPQ